MTLFGGERNVGAQLLKTKGKGMANNTSNYRVQEWDYEWGDWYTVKDGDLARNLASIYRELSKDGQAEFRKIIGNLEEINVHAGSDI